MKYQSKYQNTQSRKFMSSAKWSNCDYEICLFHPGRVKPVPAVIGYTETGVRLEGGQSLDVDLILYATGYKVNYDFIDDPRVKGMQEPSGSKHCTRPPSQYDHAV